jgi:hypothetical protein
MNLQALRSFTSEVIASPEGTFPAVNSPLRQLSPLVQEELEQLRNKPLEHREVHIATTSRAIIGLVKKVNEFADEEDIRSGVDIFDIDLGEVNGRYTVGLDAADNRPDPAMSLCLFHLGPMEQSTGDWQEGQNLLHEATTGFESLTLPITDADAEDLGLLERIALDTNEMARILVARETLEAIYQAALH